MTVHSFALVQRAARTTLALSSALLLAACESEPPPTMMEPPSPGDLALAPPDPAEGFQMALDAVAQPGEELWLCQVGTAPGHGAVGHVVSRQPEAVHHMDIMVLTLTGLRIPDGVYDCADLYADHPELMESGIFLYAAQHAEQEIVLPEGTAAVLPPRLSVMHEIHFINTGTEPVDVWSRVNAYTVPSDSVEERIWGFTVRDAHLNVPPRATHTEWTRCVMNRDVDVIFLSSHTHELGQRVEIRTFDGTNVAEEPVYVNTDWHAPLLLQLETPLHVAAGSGFEFRCEYSNPNAEMVNWGFRAADEMCQMAMVFTPQDLTADCEVVETSDGVIDTTGGGTNE
ncbi:hypothetical protein [Sandaracinus amylolyticus]|uniref:monooxygenase n=1 Tax=Sandaracinus amylolyticus TaxID=927083 RepID=UPI001F245188|nr:hypothetical protein [Sandaracinus amylolyticus]UJR86221.1 Hypothetical protein I5071_83030 [Sandaracinus amylolyticus]